MRILALDQSTERIGFCLMDADGSIESAWCERFRGKLAADRIPAISRSCNDLFHELPPESVVAVERTWLGKNPATVDVLAELRGRLIALAENAGHEVRVVAPAQWQSWIGLRRHAKRDEVKASAIAWAGRLLGIIVELNDSDLADAVCIADFVRGQIQAETIERRAKPAARKRRAA